MRSAKMRAIVSFGPPAANGTIMVIGRDGYIWAVAPVRVPRVPAKTMARLTLRMFHLRPDRSGLAAESLTNSAHFRVIRISNSSQRCGAAKPNVEHGRGKSLGEKADPDG
jgi:hypothetical protein